MNIPDEFSGRILKLRSQSLFTTRTPIDPLLSEWPGAYIDVLYESISPGDIQVTSVVVFETSEDALAFKIKYGDKYV